MSRRLFAGAGGVVMAAAAVAGGLTLGGGRDATAADTESAPAATATVQRRNLVVRETLDGTLAYADSRSLAATAAGTVTKLPAEGARVGRGGVLYEVDGQALRLLYGRKPAWRTLAAGVSDDWDVAQLEQNLVALGHDPDGDIEVDREWDWATTAAVRRWQDARGAAEDGIVELGEVVFLPGPRRIGQHHAGLGSQVLPGAEILDTSSTKPAVTVDLDAREQELVIAGQSVRVELPDGSTVSGTVREVGTVAESEPAQDGSESDPTVEVTISLARATSGLDQAPVDVAVEKESKRAALAVPVSALLALAGGGYAVEVVEGARSRLVAVELGLFADGWVEVAGALRAGQNIAVPA